MAAITTADQEERVREQIRTAVAAYREMLDTFVSDRMQRAAAEAEQVRPRQPPGCAYQKLNLGCSGDEVRLRWQVT
jgi:hypothetical protein